MLVLVVEDDEDYAEVTAELLRRDSHEAVIAGTMKSALRFAERRVPDMAVVDVLLPDGSGLDVCRQLRELQASLPILILSSLDRASDVVAGFSSGGDDYVTKPFHPNEFIARVRALARRCGPTFTPPEQGVPSRVAGKGLELDPVNQSAYLDGFNLNCTRLEFEILGQMVAYPGQVLLHSFLTERVWGYSNVGDGTLLKGHISSIRRKIRDAGGNENIIRTVHGVGYSFTPV